jgi:long-subunit fatty acid transport protein
MKPQFGFVIVALVLCVSVAFGQSEEQYTPGYPALDEVSYAYNGGSARAMAMGYAFVGLSDDVSGGIWNPAGLWALEGPIISSSYNLYTPAGEFFHTETLGSTKNDLGLNGLGHFSFVAPVRIKGHPWVFNFNYNRNNDYSDEMAFLAIAGNKLAPGPDTFVEEKGYMRTFKAGASTRLYKQLSFGFTLNIIKAQRVIDVAQYLEALVIIDPIYGTTADLMASGQVIDSTTSDGFNFTLGMMWREEKYSIGAVVHTPYAIKHSSDRTRHEEMTINDLINIDNTSTIFVVDSLAKQDVPLSTVVGLALFPQEDLTLTLDMCYQNYGSTNWYHRTRTFFEANGDRIDFFEEFPIEWNNTMGVGLGAEYQMNSALGRIPLRAGVRWDQLPQTDEISFTSSNVAYDINSEPYGLDVFEVTRVAEGRQSTTSLSLGTGIAWSQIEIDFAYMFTSGSELNLTETVIYFDESDEEDPVKQLESVYNWKRKAHEFRFTFTGYF